MPSLSQSDARYSSHLDTLRMFSPRRVLEFGPGFHSTAHFLALPDLEELVSVEVSEKWRRKLRASYNDARWTLTARKRAPKGFDLILIDDGETASQRVETIRWVLGQEHPPVVIHDAEVPQYREVYERHPHTTYALTEPWTAVVCES